MTKETKSAIRSFIKECASGNTEAAKHKLDLILESKVNDRVNSTNTNTSEK